MPDDFSRGPRAGFEGNYFAASTQTPVQTDPNEPAKVRLRLARTRSIRTRLSHRRLAE